MLATMTHDSDTLVLALATVGGVTTNRNDTTSVGLPIVAKASTSVSLSHVVVASIIIV